MASEKITHWLRARRRKTFVRSALYSLVALSGGAVLFILTLTPVFLAVATFMLLAIPVVKVATVWSVAITCLLAVVIFADSVRASRDDMSILPLWLVREYFCIGPRVLMDGFGHASKAARLAQMDIDACAGVLEFLAARKAGVSRAELLGSFPELNWRKLASQLRPINGVLLLGHEASRVSLTVVLRLELRRLLRLERVPPAAEEQTQTVSVEAPEQLSPFEILGVSTAATLVEIKSAYRSRVKECHPDRFSGMDEPSLRLAEEWTKALNSAYETLTIKHAGQRNGN